MTGKMVKKPFDKPDEVRPFEGGKGKIINRGDKVYH